MNDSQSAKPLFWVASSQSDLRRFPEDVTRIFGFALWQAQNGAKHVDAKPLKGFGGAGVLELRKTAKGNAYRAVYTIDFAEACICYTHFRRNQRRESKRHKRI